MQKIVLVCLAFICASACDTIQASEAFKNEPTPFLFLDDMHKFEMIKNYYEFKETFYKRPALTVVKSWFDWGLPTLTAFSFYRGWKKKSMLQLALSGGLGLLTLKYYADWRLPVRAWEKKNNRCVTKLLPCAQKLKTEKDYQSDFSLHDYLRNQAFFEALTKNEKKNKKLAPFIHILREKQKPIYDFIGTINSDNSKDMMRLRSVYLQEIENLETSLQKDLLTKSD